MLTIFGSINVDQVIRVPSVPAPGETVLGERVMEAHGGKGANQAVAAARSSGGTTPVVFVGAVGKDDHGRSGLQNLRDNGVVPECAELLECTTGTAIITLSKDGENAITVVPGANAQLRREHVYDGRLQNTSTLLCQGEVSLEETHRVIASFRKIHRHGLVIVNLAPTPLADHRDTLRRVLDECDVLIVNQPEAHSVSHILALSNDDNLRSIATEFDLQIVVTRGPQGAELVGTSGSRLRVPSPIVDPIDTTGAGDTFCGVFAAFVTEGWKIESAMDAACKAAARACCAVGAQTGMPHRSEILEDTERK